MANIQYISQACKNALAQSKQLAILAQKRCKSYHAKTKAEHTAVCGSENTSKRSSAGNVQEAVFERCGEKKIAVEVQGARFVLCSAELYKQHQNTLAAIQDYVHALGVITTVLPSLKLASVYSRCP